MTDKHELVAAVSGTSGFLGSNLCRFLMDSKIKVAPIERGLLTDYSELEKFLKKVKPDYIFHLGAYGNHYNQTDDNEILASNILATYLLLSASKDIPYKAFINFGSSSEYGIKEAPMNEYDLPETDTMYGASKVATTYLARAFSKKYNKPIVTVRPFSIFGPQEAQHRFIPRVINSIKTGEVIEVDPTPVHDWLDIDSFLIALLTVTAQAENLKGKVVNIGSGKQHTNLEVVQLLEKVAGKKAELKIVKKMREYDTKSWVADITRLSMLGWYPQFKLEEALKNTYEAYE